MTMAHPFTFASQQSQQKATNPAISHVLQFFSYEHLPSHLQVVSKPFGDLANKLASELPSNQETTISLRKLLEAKDAAVRALIAK